MATLIDDNAANEQSDKLICRLFIIWCTRYTLAKEEIVGDNE